MVTRKQCFRPFNRMKAFFIIKIKIIDYINILGGMKNEIDRRANANNYERCR